MRRWTYFLKDSASWARIESRAPPSNISRARRRVDCGVEEEGVRAWALRRVSLAVERKDCASS